MGLISKESFQLEISINWKAMAYRGSFQEKITLTIEEKMSQDIEGWLVAKTE
jgi:hypothetical protein